MSVLEAARFLARACVLTVAIVVPLGSLSFASSSSPEFALIPLQAGNFGSEGYGYDVYSVDGPGRQVLYSSAEEVPGPFTVIHRDTGMHQMIIIDLGTTEGAKLSGDGSRFFYHGFFGPALGLGFSDLTDTGNGLIDDVAQPLFSVDEAGAHIVYQHAAPLGDHSEYYQYEWADVATGEHRKITEEPGVIVYTPADPNTWHLSISATTPLITADGGTVVFLTEATLGLASADSTIGCRMFVYDVASQTLQQKATLPASWFHVGLPSLSGDGRWLSFTARDASSSWPVAILADLQRGTVQAPFVDVGDYVVFDARITRDGKGMVLSTTADLDSDVGNPDHNLELFYYDRQSDRFSQMSDTLGGIGPFANGCPTYRPSISDDGGVAVFSFQKFSGSGCGVNGAQRHVRDGLSFGFTRAVRTRPSNSPVVLQGVGPQQLGAGGRLSVDLVASDADGDAITFFAQTKGDLDVPVRSKMTDHFDGTARFEWRTQPTDIGQHVVTVAAFDEGGGEMFQDLMITVQPACVGACGSDSVVTVDDLLIMVNVALGLAQPSRCHDGDADSNGSVTVDEILAAVQNALEGCPVVQENIVTAGNPH